MSYKKFKSEQDMIFKKDMIRTLKQEFRLLSKAEYYTSWLPSTDGEEIQAKIVARMLEIDETLKRLDKEAV